MSNPTLPLYDLASRHHGLTPAVANAYAEAARVCLDRHHQSPVEFDIQNKGTAQPATIEWEPADARTSAAWSNEIDTTEAGAYAFALAAVELSKGMLAVRRAETRTGADYYVAPPGVPLDDLESCLRLEVSGIDRGAPAALRQRLKAKLDQLAHGSSNLPAIAGVVGFGARLILLEALETK